MTGEKWNEMLFAEHFCPKCITCTWNTFNIYIIDRQYRGLKMNWKPFFWNGQQIDLSIERNVLSSQRLLVFKCLSKGNLVREHLMFGSAIVKVTDGHFVEFPYQMFLCRLFNVVNWNWRFVMLISFCGYCMMRVFNCCLEGIILVESRIDSNRCRIFLQTDEQNRIVMCMHGSGFEIRSITQCFSMKLWSIHMIHLCVCMCSMRYRHRYKRLHLHFSFFLPPASLVVLHTIRFHVHCNVEDTYAILCVLHCYNVQNEKHKRSW